MATPGIVGERHYDLAQEIRRTLAQYAELKDIIAMLGLEQLSPEDRNVVARARRLERFLTQPFFTTEQFTGLKGKLVSLKQALDVASESCATNSRITPESAPLYDSGAIDEAKGKAKPGVKPQPKVEHAHELMNLKVLLPFQIFAEKTGVARIVAETRDGSFGLLPQRLDCVAALVPGIFDLRNRSGGRGLPGRGRGGTGQGRQDVLVSVRRRWANRPRQLRASWRGVLTHRRAGPERARGYAKLETGFLSRFASFQQ